MRWLRGRERSAEEEPSPIPAGVSPLVAATQVVAALLADPPQAPDTEIQRAEVVQLRSGQFPEVAVPGVVLEWRQAGNKFGLLMPIDRLARQAGDLDGVPFYLRLAVSEPHGESPEGARAWFTDLPSGPY